MKNKANSIILMFFTFFLVFSLTMQVKGKPQQYTPVTIETLEYSIDELNAVKNDNARLAESNREKKEKLDELSSMSDIGYEEFIDSYKNEIRERKLEIGMEDLVGPGVVITMYDNQVKRPDWYDVNFDVIHDLDIQIILNDLKIAGAEALSINDERLISKTSVRCTGPTIRVNDVIMATPIYIKAIGDSAKLYAAVTVPNTYGKDLKDLGLGFEAKVSDEILIKAYSGERKYNYARPLEEGINK